MERAKHGRKNSLALADTHVCPVGAGDTSTGGVTKLAGAGKKVATIQRHAAAIAKTPELAGLGSPMADKKIKVLLKGIAREKKARIKQATAFSLDNFKRTIRRIDVSIPTGLRNQALPLRFTAAFRQSELIALNIEDWASDEEGPVASPNKSKTGQLGQAEEKADFYSQPSNHSFLNLLPSHHWSYSDVPRAKFV